MLQISIHTIDLISFVYYLTLLFIQSMKLLNAYFEKKYRCTINVQNSTFDI